MTPHRCGHWLGSDGRHCYAVEPLRLYLGGLRCPLHTPARLAGHEEPASAVAVVRRSITTKEK